MKLPNYKGKLSNLWYHVVLLCIVNCSDVFLITFSITFCNCVYFCWQQWISRLRRKLKMWFSKLLVKLMAWFPPWYWKFPIVQLRTDLALVASFMHWLVGWWVNYQSLAAACLCTYFIFALASWLMSPVHFQS